jgi:hypothetical protein
MRTTILAGLLLAILLIASAESQTPTAKPETPTTKVAVVNLQRVMSSGIDYEKLRLLSLDKHTVEALKKISKEIQELQAQIVDINDEATLQEMQRRMNFLNQKNMLLRQQRGMGGAYNNDMQALLRKFVIEKYKNKYSLIIQQQEQGNNGDRIIYKAPGTQVDDITDDVREEYMKFLDQVTDDSPRSANPTAVAAAR